MARVPRIDLWCDNHEDRESVPGITREVNLGAGPYELELCGQCWESIPAGRLEKLCAEWGRTQNPSSLTEGKERLRCPLCTNPPLASVRTWKDHLEAKHPGKAEELLRVMALPRKGAKREAQTELEVGVEDLTCPECGRDDLETRQARAVHRSRSHGWRKGQDPP